jgi:hypothetical protein
MTKNATVAIMLLFAFFCPRTFGQVHVKNTNMKQVLLFRSNQEALRGNLVEMRDDTLVVLTANREMAVPLADIRRIIWSYERGPGRGPVIGAVAAGYLGAYLYAQSQNYGGFVRSENWVGYALFVPPSIALGAGIGYLVDPGSSHAERVFDFTGDEESKSDERARLVRAVTQDSPESKVHITFQGSHVYPRGPQLVVGNSSPMYDGSRVISDFNLLRKAQLTYSITPDLEAGIAFVWFGEPPQSSYGYASSGDFYSASFSGTQSLQAIGKCLVAVYQPLYGVLPSRLGLRVGGGAGIASLDYARTTGVFTFSPDGPGTQQDSYFSVSDNVVVWYLFGQIEYELVDGLSVGLVVDNVFGPSRGAPAVPEASIPGQELQFGNSSVGFTLGFHF